MRAVLGAEVIVSIDPLAVVGPVIHEIVGRVCEQQRNGRKGPEEGIERSVADREQARDARGYERDHHAGYEASPMSNETAQPLPLCAAFTRSLSPPPW